MAGVVKCTRDAKCRCGPCVEAMGMFSAKDLIKVSSSKVKFDEDVAPAAAPEVATMVERALPATKREMFEQMGSQAPPTLKEEPAQEEAPAKPPVSAMSAKKPVKPWAAARAMFGNKPKSNAIPDEVIVVAAPSQHFSTSAVVEEVVVVNSGAVQPAAQAQDRSEASSINSTVRPTEDEEGDESFYSSSTSRRSSIESTGKNLLNESSVLTDASGRSSLTSRKRTGPRSFKQTRALRESFGSAGNSSEIKEVSSGSTSISSSSLLNSSQMASTSTSEPLKERELLDSSVSLTSLDDRPIRKAPLKADSWDDRPLSRSAPHELLDEGTPAVQESHAVSRAATARDAPESSRAMPTNVEVRVASASVVNDSTETLLKQSTVPVVTRPGPAASAPGEHEATEESTVDMSLPLMTRIVASDWKARKSAYEQLPITDGDQPWDILVKAMETESNPTTLDAVLDAALRTLASLKTSDARCLAESWIPALSKKAIPSGREGTRRKAAEVVKELIAYETPVQPVFQALVALLSSKNVKVVSGSLSILREALAEFGLAVVPTESVLAAFEVCMKAVQKDIKDEATNLCVDAFSWGLGDSLKGLFLGKLTKDAQKREVEARLGSIPPKPTASRFRRDFDPKSEATGAQAAQAGVPKDAFSLMKASDGVAKLVAADVEKKLKDLVKWSERKQYLADIEALCGKPEPKLIDADYSPLVTVLKKVVTTDSNQACVVQALSTLTAMSKGMRAQFATFYRFLLPTLLDKYREKPAPLTKAVDELLDASGTWCAGTASVLDERLVTSITEAFDPAKVTPLQLKNVSIWLTRALTKIEEATIQQSAAKHRESARALLELLKTKAGHPEPQVRAAVTEAVNTLEPIVQAAMAVGRSGAKAPVAAESKQPNPPPASTVKQAPPPRVAPATAVKAAPSAPAVPPSAKARGPTTATKPSRFAAAAAAQPPAAAVEPSAPGEIDVSLKIEAVLPLLSDSERIWKKRDDALTSVEAALSTPGATVASPKTVRDLALALGKRLDDSQRNVAAHAATTITLFCKVLGGNALYTILSSKQLSFVEKLISCLGDAKRGVVAAASSALDACVSPALSDGMYGLCVQSVFHYIVLHLEVAAKKPTDKSVPRVLEFVHDKLESATASQEEIIANYLQSTLIDFIQPCLICSQARDPETRKIALQLGRLVMGLLPRRDAESRLKSIVNTFRETEVRMMQPAINELTNSLRAAAQPAPAAPRAPTTYASLLPPAPTPAAPVVIEEPVQHELVPDFDSPAGRTVTRRGETGGRSRPQSHRRAVEAEEDSDFDDEAAFQARGFRGGPSTPPSPLPSRAFETGPTTPPPPHWSPSSLLTQSSWNPYDAEGSVSRLTNEMLRVFPDEPSAAVVDALFSDRSKLSRAFQMLDANLDAVGRKPGPFLRWTTLLLASNTTTPAALSNVVLFAARALEAAADGGRKLTDQDADDFVPHLLKRLNDKSKAVRTQLRRACQLVCRVYPSSRFALHVARAVLLDPYPFDDLLQAECMDELARLVGLQGGSILIFSSKESVPDTIRAVCSVLDGRVSRAGPTLRAAASVLCHLSEEDPEFFGLRRWIATSKGASLVLDAYQKQAMSIEAAGDAALGYVARLPEYAPEVRAPVAAETPAAVARVAQPSTPAMAPADPVTPAPSENKFAKMLVAVVTDLRSLLESTTQRGESVDPSGPATRDELLCLARAERSADFLALALTRPPEDWPTDAFDWERFMEERLDVDDLGRSAAALVATSPVVANHSLVSRLGMTLVQALGSKKSIRGLMSDAAVRECLHALAGSVARAPTSSLGPLRALRALNGCPGWLFHLIAEVVELDAEGGNVAPLVQVLKDFCNEQHAQDEPFAGVRDLEACRVVAATHPQLAGLLGEEVTVTPVASVGVKSLRVKEVAATPVLSTASGADDFKLNRVPQAVSGGELERSLKRIDEAMENGKLDECREALRAHHRTMRLVAQTGMDPLTKAWLASKSDVFERYVSGRMLELDQTLETEESQDRKAASIKQRLENMRANVQDETASAIAALPSRAIAKPATKAGDLSLEAIRARMKKPAA